MNQSDYIESHPPGPPGFVELTASAPIWDRFFTIAPLILFRTREADGSVDVAPKCDGGGKPSLNLVQKLCSLRALNLLRRSTRVELNQSFVELVFPQTAST